MVAFHILWKEPHQRLICFPSEFRECAEGIVWVWESPTLVLGALLPRVQQAHPRTPRTPRSRLPIPWLDTGGSSSGDIINAFGTSSSVQGWRSRRREKAEETSEDTPRRKSASSPLSTKLSILLCLLVVSLSAGLKFMHHRDPSRFCRLAQMFGLKETFRYSLLWMAPVLSGGGYCSEALTFVDALNSSRMVKELRINHHGDTENFEFWKGLPPETRKTLMYLLSGDHTNLADTVVVCHSEPDAWYPPLIQTAPCPPTGYTAPRYVIGRTILETSTVNPNHVERCNKMHEIWVPTEFHVAKFMQAGVHPAKIVKVVQAVDTHFFNPAKVKASSGFQAESKILFHPLTNIQHPSRPFVFLSIFKWENQKGWDVLLSAFLQEFTADENVVLYIVTNPGSHVTDGFLRVLREFVRSLHVPEPRSGWAEVRVLDKEVPQALLPGLYKFADCFVLPSRGDGWGRPIVEAMAMELPVIATHWSGMIEYMSELNSYPLQMGDMSEIVQGPFSGHFWADPSQSRLMKLMRRVVQKPGEGKQKGRRARQDLVEQYSPEVVADVVLEQLLRIQRQLDLRDVESAYSLMD